MLHDLETTAYYVDERWSDKFARHIVRAILRWANMLICHLKVGEPCVLRFHYLTQLLPRMWLSLFPTLI